MESVRVRSLTAPVHVRIKPINCCNHDCWYCAYRSSALQLGEGMDIADRIPESKLSEIAVDLVGMGVNAVTVSGGGEPLLHKASPACIERLGRAGIRVGVLTNGTNLKGRMAEALSRWGTWARVSLDAWDIAMSIRVRIRRIRTREDWVPSRNSHLPNFGFPKNAGIVCKR